jgi:hypothetical protein
MYQIKFQAISHTEGYNPPSKLNQSPYLNSYLKSDICMYTHMDREPTYRHTILFNLWPTCSSGSGPSYLHASASYRRSGQPHGHCHGQPISWPSLDSLALMIGQFGSGRTSRWTRCPQSRSLARSRLNSWTSRRTVLLPGTFIAK